MAQIPRTTQDLECYGRKKARDGDQIRAGYKLWPQFCMVVYF